MFFIIYFPITHSLHEDPPSSDKTLPTNLITVLPLTTIALYTIIDS